MPHDVIRAEVADSWHRSAAAGVESDATEAPITLAEDTLRDYREAHPLAQVFPLLDDVLGQAARDCEAIMAISDAAGSCCGCAASRRPCGRPRRSASSRAQLGRAAGRHQRARHGHRLDRTATVIGAEHFRRSVKRWSCAATPIHDPASSSLLGVLDVTGGAELVVPQTMAMVRAAARMAEAELARSLLTRREPTYAERSSRLSLCLESLGRDEALVSIRAGSDGRSQRLRLQPRHSEILLLLASAPRGLSGDELAVLLYEDDGGSSSTCAPS